MFGVFYVCLFVVVHGVLGNNDLFTIKLHFGGHLTSNPGSYVGGSFKYVDKCDVDEISMLELYSMLTDCGVDAGFADLFYKLPKANMECGLFPVTSDSQALEMCTHLDSSRLLNLYYETSQETQLDYPMTQTVESVDEKHRKFERQQFEALFELEEINKEIIDIDDLVECLCGKEKPTEITDHENASFHEDSSNIDSTDDDVRSHKKKKSAIKDII